MNRKVLSVSLVFLLGVVSGAGYILFNTKVTSIPQENKTVCSEKAWVATINKVGEKKAYEILAKKGKSKSISKQHVAAHCFGGALYTAVGVNGFKTCDSRFSYGCFHEFMGRAIADHGIAIVKDLNTQCLEIFGDNAGFCQHGIGHGLVAYFGYTQKDLLQELSICGELPSNDPIGGCNGGIFMEYNLRSLIGETLNPRPIINGNFRAPCDTLVSLGKSACEYWAPQWWLFSDLGYKTNTKTLEIIGLRCDSFLGKAAKVSCFSGMGVLLSPSFGLSSRENAISLCTAATRKVHQDLYRRLCIKTALGK